MSDTLDLSQRMISQYIEAYGVDNGLKILVGVLDNDPEQSAELGAVLLTCILTSKDAAKNLQDFEAMGPDGE